MGNSTTRKDESASKHISQRIKELGDWRGKMLGEVRRLIRQADPEVIEEWKWRGTPVWSHGGGICTGETYKNVVKLTFFQGASMKETGWTKSRSKASFGRPWHGTSRTRSRPEKAESRQGKAGSR